MSSPAARTDSYEVKCPHCKRAFEAELLDSGAERYSGFKCPHCRLFVPLDRAPDAERARP